MAVQEMWVHGHSATIEVHRVGRGPAEDINDVPWTSVIGLRLGWGVVYRGVRNSYWFHFAVPTRSMTDGVRARLRRVMLLFTADPGVTLRAVHVWDGPDRAFAQDGLAVTGEHVTLADGVNSFVVPGPEVHWGIGVSAEFRFEEAGNVTLHCAGVELES